jgi:predicted metal-dependent phosphoesterase TrpH
LNWWEGYLNWELEKKESPRRKKFPSFQFLSKTEDSRMGGSEHGTPLAITKAKQPGLVSIDLHIHTCLSPCATLDMTPRKIVAEASRKRIEVIAVTDHNTTENALAVIKAAREFDLHVIPGIEVTTSEEVHIIGLFEKINQASEMQAIVYENLQEGMNDEGLFGMQVVANEHDEVEKMNKRLLIGATLLPVHEVVDAIHGLDGLAIAAHIDRERFSIIGQLGFIPDDLKLDAVEISRRLPLDQARSRFREYERFAFISASDAHDLEEIGKGATCLQMAGTHIKDLKQAFEELVVSSS